MTIHTAATSLRGFILQVFGPNGWLSQNGFSYRETQLDYAIDVCEWISGTADRPAAFLGAETGIGKSISYLANAAIWWALTGKRALITTHTVALQHQLIRQDWPIVIDILRALDLNI